MTFAEFDSHKAIAAKRARASEHQIAQTCETTERLRPRPQRHGQTRHFRQAARDQCRESVRSETQPLTRPGGNSHHIFHSACELHAQNVVVGIETKVWASKLFLQLGSESSIPRSQNDSRGLAASSFQGERWAGNHGDAWRRFRRDLCDHFTHPEVR